ncbi:rsfS [Symbiodinium microadriaticum]|nr:rsfS [Symbiodinium microadriaticum]
MGRHREKEGKKKQKRKHGSSSASASRRAGSRRLHPQGLVVPPLAAVTLSLNQALRPRDDRLSETLPGLGRWVVVALALGLVTLGPDHGLGGPCAPIRGFVESLSKGRVLKMGPSERSLARRARVDGEYGVLPEPPSPLIELEEKDPVLEALITVVQAADKKRGVDISAFWVKEGFEMIVMITALSRPQLQAIAGEIENKMRHELRMKRRKSQWPGQTIRDEAANGWCCMVYPRMTINIMTPVQRSYYDIESIWRDDNEDYGKVPLQEVLREEGFGNLRVTKGLQDPNDITPRRTEDAEIPPSEYEPFDDDDDLYEEDEDDPFWQIVDQRMAALRLVLDIPCSEEGRRKNAVYPKSEGQSGRGPPVRQSSEPRTGILPPAFPPFLLPPQCLDKKQTQMLGSLGSGSETTACHEISWSFRWAAFMPSAHRQGFLPMG